MSKSPTVPSDKTYAELTKDQQAIIRMWLALDLTIEATQEGKEYWWVTFNKPVPWWRYRLKQP